MNGQMWAYAIAGWLVLSVVTVAALTLILRGRHLFNPEIVPARSAPAYSSDEAQPTAESARICVLVADDDDRLRTIILSLLQADPRFHQALTAADGAQTLILAQQARPDVILLDVRMPVMTGLELLPLLHSLNPEPAVVLYASGTVSEIIRAAHDYDAHYLDKSTPLDEVLDEVACVGATRRNLRGKAG